MSRKQSVSTSQFLVGKPPNIPHGVLNGEFFQPNPTITQACRVDFAISMASGVSPCRQMVSIFVGICFPDWVMIAPASTMSAMRGPAIAASWITAPGRRRSTSVASSLYARSAKFRQPICIQFFRSLLVRCGCQYHNCRSGATDRAASYRE